MHPSHVRLQKSSIDEVVCRRDTGLNCHETRTVAVSDFLSCYHSYPLCHPLYLTLHLELVLAVVLTVVQVLDARILVPKQNLGVILAILLIIRLVIRVVLLVAVLSIVLAAGMCVASGSACGYQNSSTP